MQPQLLTLQEQWGSTKPNQFVLFFFDNPVPTQHLSPLGGQVMTKAKAHGNLETVLQIMRAPRTSTALSWIGSN